MEYVSLEESKKRQLEILDVVANFCEQHKIQYFLTCGTLIGAIRHKGFIPWDDDIDLGMLRPEYDRFMNEFNGTDTRYEFHCIENDPNFPVAFGKVFDTKTKEDIDIFVYDNASDNDREMKRLFKYCSIINSIRTAKTIPFFRKARGSKLRKLMAYPCRAIVRLLVPRNFIIHYAPKKVMEISRRYVNAKTKRIGNFTCPSYVCCDRRAFESFIDVDFEGKKYKAPVGYDEWLRIYYGDYMQLPPVEERVPPHRK